MRYEDNGVQPSADSYRGTVFEFMQKLRGVNNPVPPLPSNYSLEDAEASAVVASKGEEATKG